MTRRSTLSKQAGMTLIEVMMVVFIIGLASTLVVLTLPSRDPPEQVMAKRLTTMISDAQDSAILLGVPLGVVVDGNQVGLQTWRDGAWAAVGPTQALPPGIDVARVSTPDEELPEDWPLIVFDPTGLNEDAELQINSFRGAMRVTVTASGEVNFDAG